MKLFSLLLTICFSFAELSGNEVFELAEQQGRKQIEKKEEKKKTRSYWKKNNLLFHRFMRSSEYSGQNPSFLGIKKPYYNGRFDLVPLGIHFTNQTLSPNFLFEYFSDGQLLSDNDKSDVSSTLGNLHLLTQISANPIAFEYGPVGFDVKVNAMVNGKIKGNLLSLPFQDFVIGSTLEQNMDIEIFSYHQFGLKYGHKFKTDMATFRAGIGLNFYQGHTFFKAEMDTMNFINSDDSVAVNYSYYLEGSQMIWSQMDDQSNVEMAETFSSSTQGFDIGFGVNLMKIIKQNVDIEFGLMNLGTTLTFDKAKKERYSFSLTGEDLQNLGEVNEEDENEADTTLIYENKKLDIQIPSNWFFQVTYQPMQQLIFSVAMEKGAEKRFFTEDTPRITVRTGIYPFNWLNLNFGVKTIHGQIMQNVGFGIQSKYLDFLLNVSSYDGWQYNSHGMGINLRTSFYF